MESDSGNLKWVFGVPLVAGAGYLGHHLGGDAFAAVFAIIAVLLVIGTGDPR